jgi:FlaA1/EpsC-like NDP-sugar epimerase
VQVVFHAAAHKHVPLMQANVIEAVHNNVFGTQNMVEAALAAQVERLVLLSTDKAIRPANVYGATKRLAEMVVLEAARRSGAVFSVVRFGNVLGSRGSVIPLFRRQIAAGGPVLITHPDMERYFMTIPEAVHLVLQAASMGRGGELFLLDMGKQVRIVDLATDLIRLSGLEPGRDVGIEFTGVRPGEKLSEELWEQDKTYERTEHPDIVRSLHEAMVANGDLPGTLEQLQSLAAAGQADTILRLLDEVIPGAAISEAPAPDLTAIV